MVHKLSRKARITLFSLIFLSLLVILALSYAVFAAHSITTSIGTTAYYILEDTGYYFNITVNNTDALETANISQVNITLPSGFTFLVNSNGTNLIGNYSFSNTSSILTWSNLTEGMIMNLTWKYFWINATATTPGNYNITVTTLNVTGSYYSNISVFVNDTTAPFITLISPPISPLTSETTTNFIFNVTDSSTTNCTLILNNAPVQFSSSVNTSGSSITFTNSSFSSSNTWYVNCTDSANNKANSSTFQFNISSIHYILEDTSSLINITVNNTNTPTTANITQVNITLTSGFTFTADTNGTNLIGNYSFSNTSSILTWSNLTEGMIMNLTWKYFWFNATSSEPGNYKLVITTKNVTGSYYSNISVVVNDTTAPVITLTSPSNYSAVSSTSVDFAFTVTDSSTTNCTLILNNAPVQFSSSVNTSGSSITFTNSTSASSNTWYVNCTDSANNKANSSTFQFNVTSSTSDSTTTSPGGSPTTNKKSSSWTKITPGSATIMKVQDSTYGLKQITILVNNPAQNVKITVTKYDNKPASVSVTKTGKVYKYLQIATENLESNLSKATVTLQVPKKWVNDNLGDKNKLALFKYFTSDSQWHELETKYNSEDSNDYYYNAEINSFSYFAIAEKTGTETPTPTSSTPSSGTSSNGTSGTTGNEEKAGNWSVAFIIIILVVIIAVVVLAILEYKKRNYYTKGHH